jgi:hypothetical protein
MQPYFLPYIGYFQLIAAVDLFIVYDNIKYTKKGWINRNRMLQNGRAVMFSLPLRHDSDASDVSGRELAADFRPDKLLNQISGAYRSAPYFSQTFPLVEEVVRFEERNLFRFLHHSIAKTCRHLGLGTEIRPSSSVAANHSLTGEDRVLAICEALGASVYVNATGGRALYSRSEFRRRGMTLKFIESGPFEYAQFGGEFVPSLSIVDVMMFNSLDTVRKRIETDYDVI